MRIAIVTFSEDRAWHSCRVITRGLRRAYGLLESEVTLTECLVSAYSSDSEIESEAHRVYLENPDVIVFLDTWPFYGKFLTVLANLLKGKRTRPILRFHCYGDFTQRAFQWVSWSSLLRGFPVEWVCGSKPQLQIMKYLILGNGGGPASLWVCPFPIDPETFHPDQEVRLATRLKLGLSSNENLVLYAGRLSLQKNIIASVRAFSQLPTWLLQKSKFVLVGEFDDLPAPFRGSQFFPGEFFRLWERTLANLPPRVRTRIQVMPGVSHSELAQMYQAADAFLSLSLVHDEDFGMAAAEAAASGLPIILTRWGGFKGFAMAGFVGRWVRVRLGRNGPEFSISEASRGIKQVLQMTQSYNARVSRAKKCAQYCSIESVSNIIREQTLGKLSDPPQRFAKLTSTMVKLGSNFDHSSKSLIYQEWGKGTLYENIYRRYI